MRRQNPDSDAGRSPRRRKGFSSVLATFYVALFSGLAIAFTAFTSLNSAISGNSRDEQLAYSAAESGLSVVRYHVAAMTFSPHLTSDDIFAELGDNLAAAFNGTLNLSGQSVSVSTNDIHIPSIPTDSSVPGATFSASLSRQDTTYYVTVVGQFHEMRRTLRVAFAEQNGPMDRSILHHGIASQGSLRFVGGAVMRSNVIGGGSVMSMDPTSLLPIRVSGTGQFDGDLYMVKEGLTGDDVFSSGTSTFLNADGTAYEGDVDAHTHAGVPEPAWPTVDTAPLVNLINSLPHQRIERGTDISSLGPLHNLYIAANADPTFNSGVTITGMVYVEWPNDIKFSGSTTITGMIVFQPPPYEPGITDPATNSLTFCGAVASSGVENLPKTAEYQGLHDQTGSFLLAPDTDVVFNGAMGTINGTIYASTLDLNGATTGTIRGAILVDRRRLLTKLESVDLMFIVNDTTDEAAGLVFDEMKILAPVPSSFQELTP